MSGLGVRTKKVNVYGRKKAQIISIHTDLSNSPSKEKDQPGNEHVLRSTSTSVSPTSPLATAKRRPLKSKPSQPTIQVPPIIPSCAPIKLGKPKTPLDYTPKPTSIVRAASPENDTPIILRPHRFSRPGRAIIPPSPSSDSGIPLQATEPRERIDAVVIPIRRPRRAVRPPIIERESSLEPEITDRLAGVSIGDKIGINPSVEDPVQSLLRVCTTHEVLPWSAFLANPPFLCRGEAQKGRQAVITKTGEASYSEVYGITAAESAGVVVKVIPLISSEPVQFKKRITQEDYPDCSEPKDVAREIEITRRMSELPQGGFVEFLQAFVVEGDYPDVLLEQWDEYKSSNGSDSIRPDCFPTLQKFAVIVLSHGGPDLERFRFDTTHGWIQAAGVFFQVAAALARAEEWTEFEHRDLHEGQILITACPTAAKRVEADYTSPSSTGVQTTIIDFGLSRLALPSGEVALTPLPEDVYDGVGEQWDVYRQMKSLVGEDWQDFHGETNVMWLHYLARYLLTRKSLKKPKSPTITTTTTGNSSSPFRPSKRIPAQAAPRRGRPPKDPAARAQAERAYAALMRMEEGLATNLRWAGEGKGTRERKNGSRVIFATAGELMQWAREEGWVC